MPQDYRDLIKGHGYTTVTVNTKAFDEVKLPPDVDAQIRKDREFADLILNGALINFHKGNDEQRGYKMTNDEIMETCLKCIITYGKESQTEIAIEEASELIKALCKLKRPDAEFPRTNLIEELADMQIMLIQMIMIYADKNTIEHEIEVKLKRQKERMTNEPEIIKAKD